MILVPSAAKPPAQVASRFIPHRPSTSCIGFSLEPLPHGRNKARSKIGRSRLFSAFPEISAGPALDEQNVVGMTELLNSLKWGSNGLVTVIVQNVDTGEVCMQAFADRAAVCETLQTGLATFYSRSRGERWCKGETSGNFVKVSAVYPDCDRDSLIYLGDPIGPSCHTGARTCWFSKTELDSEGSIVEVPSTPESTLFALEQTIKERKLQATSGLGSSWTAKLLSDPKLLCEKVREEAGELCQSLEMNEGKERTAEEMADVLYHSLVLLNLQGVEMSEVLRILRGRFGVSGLDEKRSRRSK